MKTNLLFKLIYTLNTNIINWYSQNVLDMYPSKIITAVKNLELCESRSHL